MGHRVADQSGSAVQAGVGPAVLSRSWTQRSEVVCSRVIVHHTDPLTVRRNVAQGSGSSSVVHLTVCTDPEISDSSISL